MRSVQVILNESTLDVKRGGFCGTASASEWGENSEIPPTGVGGWFRSSLQRDRLQKSKNPTNGSWWIVQIQPVHVEDP